MCLLAICDTRKLTREEFNLAWDRNPDGVGLAWADGTLSHFRKGLMSRHAAWKAYGWVPAGAPHLVHFRLASSGGVTPVLTHPFLTTAQTRDLARDAKAPLLFHNGVVPNWEAMLAELRRNLVVPKPPLSDTQALALLLGVYGERRHAELLARSQGGKYAVLYPTGRVLTVGTFTELDGVRVSNTYNLAPRPVWDRDEWDALFERGEREWYRSST